MTRYLLFLISVLLVSNTATLNAQDRPLPTEDLINPRINLPAGVSVVIKIGGNIYSPLITHNPTAVYNTSPAGEFVPGFNAGIGLTFALSGRISLFADVQYISSTAKYLIGSGNFSDEFTEDLNLFSIPLGARYRAGSGGIKYYPFAGIAPDYLVNSDFSYVYHPFPDESAYTENGEFDITFERNRFHVNGILGFGFQYQVRGLFMGVEISYRHGLRNYINTDDMRSMQIYFRSSEPIEFQSPGFRTQGFLVNLTIQKTGK